METLNCVKCGRELMRVPAGVDLDKGAIVSADWAVPENMQGPQPERGDAYKLTCVCGERIISPYDLKRTTRE